MGESKLGAILVFLRRTDGSRTVRLLTADGPPWWFSEPRTVCVQKCGWSANVKFFQLVAELTYIIMDWFYYFSNCSYG